jgi:hypothetical protein
VRWIPQQEPGGNGHSALPNSGQFGARSDKDNVQAVSKQSADQSPTKQRIAYGKTDVRYWHDAVFKPSYTQNGVARQTYEWAIKVQHLGHRETFSLGTANRAAAAGKAKQIYR